MIFDSRGLLYLTTIYNKQDAKIYSNMSLFTLIVCLLPNVVWYMPRRLFFMYQDIIKKDNFKIRINCE